MRGVRIINHLRRHSLASVPEGVLLDWCEQEAEVRYPTIACVIPISNSTDEAGPRKWTTIALRLLDKAPDRVEVLKQFIGQFHPRGGWSSSLAAILESNAKLLDQLDRYPDFAVIAFVRDEKKRLAKGIENEKQRETAFDRRRDERFE